MRVWNRIREKAGIEIRVVVRITVWIELGFGFELKFGLGFELKLGLGLEKGFELALKFRLLLISIKFLNDHLMSL